MRLNLLTVSILLGASAAMAADAPTLAWANLFDGSTTAGDQAENISPASDGSVYWHNIGGSTTATPDIIYAGEKLFTGSNYDGTSNNGNLCVMKTNADGSLLWDLHSATADFASNQGGVAATPDGGVVFTAKLRHTDNVLDADLKLVDGRGETHTLAWTVSQRYYRGLIGYIAPDGSLEWAKFIDLATTAGDSDNFVSDAFSVCEPAVDSEGNIFITGYFSSAMTLPAADGSLVLQPNLVEADGVKKTIDTMYLAKFNADGECTAHLQDGGSTFVTKALGVTVDGSDVYFQGWATSAEGSLSLGGVSYEVKGAFSPIVARLSASDLSVKWVKAFEGEKFGTTYGYQNTSLSVAGDNLWLCGQMTGSISDLEDPELTFTTQSTIREGFILKLNAADGNWLKGVASRESYGSAGVAGTGLTGYLDIFEVPGHADKVYVYGYVMNGTVGIFLRTYDAETLVSDPAEAWTLMTSTGTPSAIACAFRGDVENPLLYMSGRANKTVTLGDETLICDNWAVVMGCYNLPASDFATGVQSVEMVTEEGEAVYYTLSGLRVNGVPTEAGIYVRRAGNSVSKVVVRN